MRDLVKPGLSIDEGDPRGQDENVDDLPELESYEDENIIQQRKKLIDFCIIPISEQISLQYLARLSAVSISQRYSKASLR